MLFFLGFHLIFFFSLSSCGLVSCDSWMLWLHLNHTRHIQHKQTPPNASAKSWWRHKFQNSRLGKRIRQWTAIAAASIYPLHAAFNSLTFTAHTNTHQDTDSPRHICTNRHQKISQFLHIGYANGVKSVSDNRRRQKLPNFECHESSSSHTHLRCAESVSTLN